MGEVEFQKANSFAGLDALQFIRHIVQAIVFVALNAKVFGIASTNVIVPYLWPTQAPFSTVHGAYESLEYTICRGVFPLVVLGVIYLTAVTVGKVFCGWACPLGLVQDLLSYIPFKKVRVSRDTASSLKDIKWAVVIFSILVSVLVGYRRTSSPHIYGDDLEAPAGIFSDAPFAVISPSGTLFAYLPWMVVWESNVFLKAGIIGWLKMFLLIAVVVPSLYIPRFFCRFVCPLSAIMDPVSAYKVLRLRRSSKLSREEFNKKLNDVCPMGVQLSSNGVSSYIDDANCNSCGKCVTSTGAVTQTVF